MPVRSQPASAVSETVYWPGSTSLPWEPLSTSEVVISPVKSNDSGELAGSVCFSMTILPSCRLLKTQRTVSPGSTLKVAVEPLPLLLRVVAGDAGQVPARLVGLGDGVLAGIDGLAVDAVVAEGGREIAGEAERRRRTGRQRLLLDLDPAFLPVVEDAADGLAGLHVEGGGRAGAAAVEVVAGDARQVPARLVGLGDGVLAGIDGLALDAVVAEGGRDLAGEAERRRRAGRQCLLLDLDPAFLRVLEGAVEHVSCVGDVVDREGADGVADHRDAGAAGDVGQVIACRAAGLPDLVRALRQVAVELVEGRARGDRLRVNDHVRVEVGANELELPAGRCACGHRDLLDPRNRRGVGVVECGGAAAGRETQVHDLVWLRVPIAARRADLVDGVAARSETGQRRELGRLAGREGQQDQLVEATRAGDPERERVRLASGQDVGDRLVDPERHLGVGRQVDAGRRLVVKPSEAFTVAVSESVPVPMRGPSTYTVLLNVTDPLALWEPETQVTFPVVSVPAT